jgi:hypothetical protein
MPDEITWTELDDEPGVFETHICGQRIVVFETKRKPEEGWLAVATGNGLAAVRGGTGSCRDLAMRNLVTKLRDYSAERLAEANLTAEMARQLHWGIV